MTSLFLAALFFTCIHLFVSGTTLRDQLVKSIGEKAYMGLFSLASILGLAWMILAYRRVEVDEVLWSMPVWFGNAGPSVVALAFLLAIGGLTTPNPTSAQMEGLLDKEDAAKGMVAISRHPFQWGMVLWATYHVIINGQIASTIFFGAFAVLSFFGTFSIDRKRARNHGEAWTSFAAKTSNVPFIAIAQGRNKFSMRDIGWWRVLLGMAIYMAFVYYHYGLFGVPPMPGYFPS
jgi:uncharacterized membrane protein